MRKAAAWVMKVDELLYVSVSQMELVHIINTPYSINVPQAPKYCQDVIIWNDNILPVVDLSVLSNQSGNKSTGSVIAIIIYRDLNDEIQYGGVVLTDSPELEPVENSQLCQLPEHAKDLRTFSLSCFISKAGNAVPILDMSKIFAKNHLGQQPHLPR